MLPYLQLVDRRTGRQLSRVEHRDPSVVSVDRIVVVDHDVSIAVLVVPRPLGHQPILSSCRRHVVRDAVVDVRCGGIRFGSRRRDRDILPRTILPRTLTTRRGSTIRFGDRQATWSFNLCAHPRLRCRTMPDELERAPTPRRASSQRAERVLSELHPSTMRDDVPNIQTDLRRQYQSFVDNGLLMTDHGLMSSHDRVELGAADARRWLLAAGGRDLPRRPWQHRAEPADDVSLLRLALWRASTNAGSASMPEIEAALSLLNSARSDFEALETALLFTARSEGMTWTHIADLLGMRSPQAAQQRYQRGAKPADDERDASGDDS